MDVTDNSDRFFKFEEIGLETWIMIMCTYDVTEFFDQELEEVIIYCALAS